MDHPRIDEEHIVDRYLAGRLGAEDEALFEEHLFECAGCLEEAKAGEELRRGLRAVAAEGAARAVVATGLIAWLRGRRPSQLAGLLGVALGVALALVVMPVLLLNQQAELGRLEKESAKQAARGTGQASAGEAGLAQPLANLLVISLGVTRDAAGVVEIRPDPGKDALLLSLELPAVDSARYRITLEDAAGGLLWSGGGLEPNLYDSLLVALPSSFLKPGEYRITVEGESAQGLMPAGEMEFRVLP